jgi:hypothetical protein
MAVLPLRFTGHHQDLARQEVTVTQSRAVCRLDLFAAVLLLGSHGFAHAQPEVDLALVLAVDTSSSMDADEVDLQRQGYVEAFRSAAVHNAIRSGMSGRIAVIYVDWSDASDQRIVVPWTVIGNAEEAIVFAKRLEDKPTRRAPGATSISGAIDFGRHLLMTAPFETSRKVIDISGEGPTIMAGQWRKPVARLLFRASPSMACPSSSSVRMDRWISGM